MKEPRRKTEVIVQKRVKKVKERIIPKKKRTF